MDSGSLRRSHKARVQVCEEPNHMDPEWLKLEGASLRRGSVELDSEL